MKIVILEKDGPEGTAKRPLYREAHLQRLEQWVQKGKVILAGPLTDKTGSLIVVEAEYIGRNAGLCSGRSLHDQRGVSRSVGSSLHASLPQEA